MRRSLLFSFALAASAALLSAAPKSGPRVATFKVDATPWKGEPLIWVVPTSKVEDPLLVKGVVIEDSGNRYVLCALDWCALSNSAHDLFRSRIAAAAGTDVARVAMQTVHQHTAPYIDGDATKIMSKLASPPNYMSDKFLNDLTDRLAAAVKQATTKLEPFDRIGTGQARVERVASERRIKGADGKIVVRWSSNGGNKFLQEAPEGAIDPFVKTITLARGTKPLVRIHYYASHPQTFCCDGTVTSDFVGAAREAVEKKEGVFQIYFNGAGGDVTAGKYNDKSPEARQGLAARMQTGLEASDSATKYERVGKIAWQNAPLTLVARPNMEALVKESQEILRNPGKATGQQIYEAAIYLAWVARKKPLDVSSLQIGRVRILNLPGEPSLQYQFYAQQLLKGDFVAVAGYGDCASGYLVLDKHYQEGGYEPGASNAGPGSEARIKTAIQQVMAR
ncbi:MAG: hypothetical protein ABFD86_20725 [Bryobacteraceae bacterium]